MNLNGFISIITTCKGRMHHLEEALPTWTSQVGDNYEVIVVDYGDPNKSADYVEELCDHRVRAVRYEAEGFNLSHARNLGALAASPNADTLLFLDADAVLTNDSFVNYHRQKVLNSTTYANGWVNKVASGCCMIWKDWFFEIRGFNEIVDGWGIDDLDFYQRIEMKGYRPEGFHNGIRLIQHSDEERVMYYAQKDIWQSNDKNWHSVKREFRSCV